jgi:hypothetical protein
MGNKLPLTFIALVSWAYVVSSYKLYESKVVFPSKKHVNFHAQGKIKLFAHTFRYVLECIIILYIKFHGNIMYLPVYSIITNNYFRTQFSTKTTIIFT